MSSWPDFRALGFNIFFSSWGHLKENERPGPSWKYWHNFLQHILGDDVIKFEKYLYLLYQWSEYRLVAYHFIQNDETISKIPMATLSGIENFEIIPKNDIDDDDVIKYKKEPCTSNQWSEYSLIAYHSTQNDETN